MAIKKSELYSKIWASCDELRGGMDASQYKDYVLVMLFIKYISDKYANVPFAPIEVPAGASFDDMCKFKGKPDIGDLINKKIIEPLEEANALSDMPDFADVNKLGDGKEQVDRLTNLIAIFEDPKLNFSNNRADDDDLLGDAYEYLMRHFATQSGKSKGQFYTPTEVSRILANIINVKPENTTAQTTVYDPTCGSGSLLLKVASVAQKSISLYGQEKDNATAGLARMNMILHNNPSAKIEQGNTLAKPSFLKSDKILQQFDYVVANPPFSDKGWTNGVNPETDKFKRFDTFGEPPAKNGDYAYLLHIIRSLKQKGKGACILPHGVLFRGNAEEEIRKNLIKKGYIKGIVGLPANLFYGTGIPACIIVIDKELAHTRKGIFMIDASKGFIKDGNKNRLRERDLHHIIRVFNEQTEITGFSKNVSFTDIARNDYNLNIPRYIDNQESDDIQDIEAHLLGGIPKRDIEALNHYWEVYPQLKNILFGEHQRNGYVQLNISTTDIKNTIYQHPEFIKYSVVLEQIFENWKTDTTAFLKKLDKECSPKKVIHVISEDLLKRYSNKALIDPYDIYQILMSYWIETMQDDLYIIDADGWKAETYRILVKNKKGKEIDKGWTSDLIPKDLVINRFYPEKRKSIANLQARKDDLSSQIATLEEEHAGEGGYFADFDKINKTTVTARRRILKDLQLVSQKEKEKSVYGEEEMAEFNTLTNYLDLLKQISATTSQIKLETKILDDLLYAHYPKLTAEIIMTLAVDDKWMAALQQAVQAELDRISQRLTKRITELADRYQHTVNELTGDVQDYEAKVATHLQKMGFTWT